MLALRQTDYDLQITIENLREVIDWPVGEDFQQSQGPVELIPKQLTKWSCFICTPAVAICGLAPYFLLLSHRPPTPGWQAFRFLFLPALLSFCLFLRRNRHTSGTPTPQWDLMICSVIFIWSLSLNHYLDLIMRRAFRGDTGWVVEVAIDLLFRSGLNPYQQTIQTVLGSRGYNGFHYGPLMLFGYAAVIPFPQFGLVFTNVVLASVMFLSLALLTRPRAMGEKWHSNALFACLMLWVIPQFRFQLFVRAGPDALPTALILMALVAVDRAMWIRAGIAVGLALSAKFAPAVFLFLLLIRRSIASRFLLGIALGASILIPFLWHDARALWMNSVWFHIFKPSARTSIYPYLPTAVHITVRFILGGLFVLTLLRSWLRPLEIRDLTFSLLCVMTLAELGSSEVHLNHFVWFMPLFVLLFTWYRGCLVKIQPA